MSGGSMNYLCFQVEESVKYFENPLIRELIKDISVLMHDREWADSGDYSDGNYNKSERKFLEKWFTNYKETLEKIIITELDSTKNILLNSIGKAKYCKECKHWVNDNPESEYGKCKDNHYLNHGYEFGCEDWSDE